MLHITSHKYPKSEIGVVEAPTTAAHLFWVEYKSHGTNCIDVVVSVGEKERDKGGESKIGGKGRVGGIDAAGAL